MASEYDNLEVIQSTRDDIVCLRVTNHVFERELSTVQYETLVEGMGKDMDELEEIDGFMERIMRAVDLFPQQMYEIERILDTRCLLGKPQRQFLFSDFLVIQLSIDDLIQMQTSKKMDLGEMEYVKNLDRKLLDKLSILAKIFD